MPLHIDMTPLVDLAFLLISFFIFTTTLSQPRVTRLYMPKDNSDPTPLKESEALTILLGANNKLYSYAGRMEDALSKQKIIVSSYDEHSGIGRLIRDKQKELGSRRDQLTLVIKPAQHCNYKNLVDALDETQINSVKRYAIAQASKQEQAFLERK